MSKDSYRVEYDAEFLSGQTTYFDQTSIQSALCDYDFVLQPEAGKVYSIGWDPARKIDASVVTILSRASDGQKRIEYIRAFESVSFAEQVPEIVHLRDIFSPVLIVVEETGLGLGPCDSLERMGVKIERWKATSESKARAYDALRSAFDRREITIPMEPFRLKHQLELLSYEALPSGSIRIGSSHEHDDFVTSLCLANYAFAKSRFSSERFISVSGRMRGATHW